MRDGVLSLFEQGLGSCANQMISILVARNIAPDGYGAFTLAFSILLMAGVLYYALIVEPMMVFGSGKYAQCFTEYLTLLSYGHWVVTGSLTTILAAAAAASVHLGNRGIATAFASAAVALPFNTYLSLLRPACYVRKQVRLAAMGSFLNLTISVVGMVVLYWTHTISTFNSFAVIATAAAGACVFIRVGLMRDELSERYSSGQHSRSCPTIRGTVRDHLSFGGANLLAALAFLASGQLMPLVLIPMFIGLEAEAAVGVVANLFGPLNLMMRSAAVLMLPEVSRQTHLHGLNEKVRRHLYLVATGCAAVACLYGAAMVLFGRPIMRGLYRGQYRHSEALILIFSISYVASSIEQVLAMGLKAIRKIRTLLFARGVAALISPLLAIPALLVGNVPLVIGAFALGYVIAGAVVAYRMQRENEPERTFLSVNS